MNPLKLQYRKLRRTLENLRGYLDLDPSNDVVRRTDFTRCPQPVLLLCGFLSTRRTFEVLERRLRRDGYGVWSINLGLGGLRGAYNTRGIDECAERVREKVERLYAKYDPGPLSIIGHSKGGLIGHYYVKRLGGDARVRTLITLGTPHQGTRTAYLGCALMGAVSRSVWQMTPMSSFLRELHRGDFPNGVRFVSMYSRTDRVSPYPCCVLEAGGKDGGPINMDLPDIGHREFLYKKSVYDLIRRELALGYGDKARRPRLRTVLR